MRLIKGGRVIDPASGRDETGSLLLDGGKVADFIPGPDGPRGFDGEVFDAAGMWVVPGLVDMHVHLREPGFEWKEDIASGTKAAAAGGFTSVACMANTKPVADSPETVRYIVEKAKGAHARVFPVAAVTVGLEGHAMADYTELAEAGAVAFSDDGKPVESPLLLRRALEYLKPFGLPILSHCEVTELCDGGAANEGWTALSLGIPGIPAAAEEISIARDILLARLTGGRVHLQHVSTKMGVELLRMAKRAGLPVTGETAPHYFTLTDAALEGYDTHAKMNPPLRGEEDRMAVLEGLLDGTFDAVATDHAPHDDYVKRCEFAAAANGILGLQTALPLSLALVAAGKMKEARLVELLSAAPARILGLKGKGTLAKGADADVTVIDPGNEWEFRASDILSKSKNSPFVGWKLAGRAVLVVCEGRTTFDLASGGIQ
jgi:dihydroorotase